MFVDPAVADQAALTANLKAGVEVIVLDATRDGVQQISEALAGRQDVSAIYIVCTAPPANCTWPPAT